MNYNKNKANIELNMKNMKKYMTLGWLLTAIILGFVSCQDLDILENPNDDPVKEGYVRISFDAEIPAMSEVHTKVVDPDGEDIANITLFCFGPRGLFISTVDAILEKDSSSPSLSGSFEAEIPAITERIHFVANQNMDLFDQNSFIGKSETEVLSVMEGSSGMMIYWSRFVKQAGSTIPEQLNGKTVSLTRNHAMISIGNPENQYVDITGFAAVNTNAFGTVAPYCAEHGWEAPSYEENRIFVTIPHNEAKLSDINDVRTIASEPHQYVFESENTMDDPVSVILRGISGGTAKYYRVMLMDENGEFIPIMRNHSYIINIAGELSFGQDTFDDALNAPATNNVWVSISDDIKTVSDSEYSLSVEHTHIVINDEEMPADNMLSLAYSLKKVDGSSLDATDIPTVTWVEGSNVSRYYSFDQEASSFSIATGNGVAAFELDPLTSAVSKREGTVLIKFGVLQRKIKVTLIKTQNFLPAWITTNVYGTGTGEKVTMMFTIPDDCPPELFPMDVLVSVDDLDVRNESGMILPIIRNDDERYGKDVYELQGSESDVFTPTDSNENPLGYKYVLTVTKPGKQRLYLQTILSHELQEGESQYIDLTVEAKHFQPVTKRTTFQNDVNNYILIHNLRSYVAAQPADEVIYFYLVPQKKGAIVEFPTHLGEKFESYEDAIAEGYTLGSEQWGVIDHSFTVGGNTIGNTEYYKYLSPDENDEFLFYSKYLDHAKTEFFKFYNVDETSWGTGGRVFGFTRTDATGLPGYGAQLHMITNSSRSEEVVRVATNPKGQPSVKGTGTSQSTPYRSAIFELSTFQPFHFAATFNGEGTVVEGRHEEDIDEVEIPYGAGEEAEIEFDITSFMSDIETVDDLAQELSVDPFGRQFEIYIDAPNFELADNALPSGKLREDTSVPGRFIYTVDASRETERTHFSSSTVKIQDNSKLDYLRKPISGGVNQSGERKTIRLKTKNIVSAGNIVISSQEEEVVFYKKTFKVNNKSITGTIKFGENESSLTDIPARSFVPMETVKDGTRIGSMTIHENGKYELRLRAEYDFNWETDKITFEFLSACKHYSTTVNSVAELMSESHNLVLLPSEGH